MKTLTDSEVFHKCIQIAVDDGWDMFGTGLKKEWLNVNTALDLVVKTRNEEGNALYTTYAFEEVIFNHDFLKHFFGEEIVCEPGEYDSDKAYRYHTKELALSENRIDYLREYLKTHHE